MSLIKEKKRASLKDKRILIAEDMEINAEIVKEVLAIKEMVTEHAANGKIALSMFGDSDEFYYDAILMDVRMPEMDGLEATKEIRALDRKDASIVPIIAMTANAFDEDVQRSLQVGMNAHLSKPVEPERLYRSLEELIWEAETKRNA
ncbi:MAG: response regulator [Lachnospiraceae bacterium]|nr:response regulator [Lachnospiraceae bacterium]